VVNERLLQYTFGLSSNLIAGTKREYYRSQREDQAPAYLHPLAIIVDEVLHHRAHAVFVDCVLYNAELGSRGSGSSLRSFAVCVKVLVRQTLALLDHAKTDRAQHHLPMKFSVLYKIHVGIRHTHSIGFAYAAAIVRGEQSSKWGGARGGRAKRSSAFADLDLQTLVGLSPRH
jgi:hypothetical protein